MCTYPLSVYISLKGTSPLVSNGDQEVSEMLPESEILIADAPDLCKQALALALGAFTCTT